jgi:hypothetical protein
MFGKRYYLLSFLLPLWFGLSLTGIPAAAAKEIPQGQDIIGTWTANVGGQQWTVVFNAGGSLTVNGTSGTYRFGGGTLTITLGGQTVTYNATLSGNTLTLSGGDLNAPLTFTRQGAAQSGAAQTRPAGAGGTQNFVVYTSKANSNFKIGHPVGWTVGENPQGFSVMETSGSDSAGVEIILGQLQAGAASKEAFADTILQTLRGNYFPDLKVQAQGPHPQAPQALVLDVGFSSSGVPFLARAWCTVDPQSGIGLFIAFYAPAARFQSFSADEIILRSLAPMFGIDQPAATTSTAQGVSTGTAGGGGEIVFVLREGENNIVCALNPSMGQIAKGRNAQILRLATPGRRHGADRIIFPVLNYEDGRMIAGNGAAMTDDAVIIAPNIESSSITHPSFSRDGNLVAVRVKNLKHYGTVNTVDYSGAYMGSYSAIAADYRIISFEIAGGRPHAVYFQKEMVGPSEGQTWCPAFSPTQDQLAYADNLKIYLCETHSGRLLREFPVPQDVGIMENSGVAFSPDGNLVACIGYTNRMVQGESVRVYAITFVDIRTGQGNYVLLPLTVRPYSPVGYGGGTICLDFSPDGRYVVFSGTPKNPEQWWGYDMLESIGTEEKPSPSDLYVVDMQTGNCVKVTNNGAVYDPVWKGR